MSGEELTGYNFGDCEIREIVFDHPNALIIVRDPFVERDVHVKLFEVRNMIFSSDHLQNVVGGIYVFNLEEYEQEKKRFAFLRECEGFFADTMLDFPETVLLYAYGIAGGDLLCQVVRIEHSVIGLDDAPTRLQTQSCT